jgi:iron complex transport system permease protein
MTRSPAGRALLRGVLLLLVLLAVAVAIALATGASEVSLAGALRGEEPARTILLKVRLPRIVLAALVGATLAVCGATFQTILRNPLADPFILGVSGGAACGAAIATAAGLAVVPGVVPGMAFAGACAATMIVLLLARAGLTIDPLRLLLSGMVLNAFFSALILLLLSLIRGSDLTAALRWMMGTFFTARWSDAAMLGIAFAIVMAVLAALASDLRMLAFGEEDARSRGVNTKRVLFIAFVAGSIATGAAVAVSGIIGFVGLLVPHGIRMIWRYDYRLLLPLSAIGGAALLVGADALARSMIAPAELPVGALTALLGVPFFLILLRRSR